MQVKRNEATLNRPEGERILDAPYVFIDLEDSVRQIKEEKAWKNNDRNGITVFKGNGLTTVLTSLHKGARIKDNSVDGLFEVHILKGRVLVTTDTGDLELKEGEMMIFHSRVRHTIEALKKTTMLLQTTQEANGIQ